MGQVRGLTGARSLGSIPESLGEAGGAWDKHTCSNPALVGSCSALELVTISLSIIITYPLDRCYNSALNNPLLHLQPEVRATSRVLRPWGQSPRPWEAGQFCSPTGIAVPL